MPPCSVRSIAFLPSLRTREIVVGGYTDNAAVGEQLQSMGVSNNLDLSCKRAASVVVYLAAQGVNKNLLSAQCFGETQPVTEHTRRGSGKNRRVNITLTGDGTPVRTWPETMAQRFVARALLEVVADQGIETALIDPGREMKPPKCGQHKSKPGSLEHRHHRLR